jgi:hypothetical protein
MNTEPSGAMMLPFDVVKPLLAAPPGVGAHVMTGAAVVAVVVAVSDAAAGMATAAAGGVPAPAGAVAATPGGAAEEIQYWPDRVNQP